MYRLPGVFGKWARPNYNSVVATFCHNTVHGLPLSIHDPRRELRLVYIDDVVDGLPPTPGRRLAGGRPGRGCARLPDDGGRSGRTRPRASARCRDTLMIERVGTGLVRALYSTYISYLPPEQFSYTVPKYGDPRGVFAEVLKTPRLRAVLVLHRASRRDARRATTTTPRPRSSS